MNASTDYSTSSEGKNIRHLVPNMLQTTFSFQNYTQDPRLTLSQIHTLQTPGPSPALRPISSPMTPITPLVLGDPQAKDWLTPKEHEQNSYFFHNQHPDSSHNYIHSPVTVALQHSPSPFSSGSSTPTYANNNTINLLNGNNNGYPPTLPSSSRPRSCPSSPTLNAMNRTSIMANVHDYYHNHNHTKPPESQPLHQYAMVGLDSGSASTRFQDLIVANVRNEYYPHHPQSIRQSPQQPQHYPDGVSMHDIHRLNAEDMQDLMDGMCSMNIGNEAH